MSTAQEQKLVDFSRGLYSGTSRFDQPKGSVPRVSNLVYLRRGALRTTDGTVLYSSLNGNGATIQQAPFRWLGRYAPSSSPTPLLYALQVVKALGTVNLINVTGKSYAPPPLASFTSSFPTPSFIQAQDYLVISLGFDQPPQLLLNGVATPLVNTWGTSAATPGGGGGSSTSALPQWTASTQYTGGSQITPSPPNGFSYVFKVATSKFGSTGTSQPTFPLLKGQQVVDGSLVWTNNGAYTPPSASAPPPTPPPAPFTPSGATSTFYHGGFLFIWGTSATYQNDGINGPDALLQSDLLNFTSFNPVNVTYVGKGDGTLPRGGGVMTLSEAGIAATEQLILFKDIDTYAFNGFFPLWTLTKIKDGVGCAAAGTIQFLPGIGLMRLSYRGFAVCDGQEDYVEQYTDSLRAYLFGDDEAGITPVDWPNANLAMSALLDNPKMYLCAVPLVGSGGALTRIFAFDVAIGSWAVIDLPWPIASMAYVPQNALSQRTFFGGFSDGTIQTYANNAASAWNSTPVTWGLRTPEIGTPAVPVYLRRVNIRGQAAYGFPFVTSAVLNYQDINGIIRNKPLAIPPPARVLTSSLDVDTTCLSGNIDITGQGAAIIEGIEYQYTPKPPSRIDGGLQLFQPSPVVIVAFQKAGSVTVPGGSNNLTVTLPAQAPFISYVVSIEPNWNTATWVSGKTLTQFNVYFNVPAPPDGTGAFDWVAQISL